MVSRYLYQKETQFIVNFLLLRTKDCHRTSTNFRLGIMSWVHELFKWPCCLHLQGEDRGSILPQLYTAS